MPERAEAGVDTLLADGEELLLGTVDRLADVRSVLVADAGDPTRGGDEVAQDGLALDDPGVVDRVHGRRSEVDEARQVGRTADLIELRSSFQDFRHGDDVDRLAALVEVEHRLVDRAVIGPVEVRRTQEVGDLDDRVAIDEEGAEDRLLGFDRLRRKAVDGQAAGLRTGWMGP